MTYCMSERVSVYVWRYCNATMLKKSLRGLGHNNCTQILFKIFPFFHSHRVRVSHQKQQTATSHNHFYWCIFYRHFLVSNAVVYYDVCLVQNSRSNLLFFMHMVGFWTTIAIAIENINIKKKKRKKHIHIIRTYLCPE